MIVMKFASPPHRGTTCTCRCSASDPPADVAQIEADVEAVRPRNVLDDANRLLDERHQLAALRLGQILEFGDPAVRHHHQVARVVRVEVEHGVDQLAAGHHQTVLVGQLRDVGERLLLSPSSCFIGASAR